MLDPRAIALQGIGFSPLLVAVQGFAEALVAISYADANARAYGKKRTRDYNPVQPERQADWALQMQIAEEDEIVLAVVMAATPLLGANAWQQ